MNYFLESIEFLKKEGMKICNIDATRDKDLVSEDISQQIRLLLFLEFLLLL